MENKKRYILMGIIMMILVVSVGTYAWLSYRSSDTAMVLTIGEVGSINITLAPYKFNSSIDPTVTYEGNDYVSVTAKNESSQAYKIKLYYKINDIPEELIDSSFKYTILRSTDGEVYEEYDSGNFSNAATGSEYIILDEEKLNSDVVYHYQVYLWIEGSLTDNTDMQGKVFNAELRADYEKVESATQISYEELASNYSCANSSVGDNPIFTYTGDCEIVQVNNVDWKVRFLTDGNLIFNEDIYVEAFLLGAGGSGTCNVMSEYDTWYCASGGGGYHGVISYSLAYGSNYGIIIGQPNGGDTIAFGTTINGGENGWVSSSGHGNGAGGEACYEFEEATGDILYSGTHDVRGEVPPMNTGRGGWHTQKAYGTTSGSAGIVIIRPKESEVTIKYNNEGGNGCGTKYAMIGDTYGDLCVPTRSGYIFAGWYTSTDYVTEVTSNDIVPSSSDVNLYAYWIEKPEPLMLIDNGDITSVTGGWLYKGNSTSKWSFNSSGVLIFSLNAEGYKGPYYHVAIPNNKLYLTPYSTYNVTFTKRSESTCNIVVINTDDISSYTYKGVSDTSIVAYMECPTIDTYSLDISNLLGEYYIAIALHEDTLYGTYTTYISKVWLE